jgi:mannosyltransferase
LAAIVVLAASLRLLFLSQDSFWHDEILSVERALMDGEDFWDLIQGLPNMAFYYWLLRYWVVLGESEIVVRMLSVVAAVAAVLAVYSLGARLFGPRVGVMSAFLLAINAL